MRVEILLPGPHTDQRACRLAGQRHYTRLLEAGVLIRQYQPTMLHTKIMTVDSVASLIGSTNFNRRSMDHDEEVMLAVLDEKFTALLDGDHDADLKSSVAVDLARWRRRAVVQRAEEAAVTPIRRFL